MIDAPQRPGQPVRPPVLVRLMTACRGWVTRRPRQSWYMIASCIALVALAFLTHPGHIISDTKLDLAVNPEGFLARALHLWDPSQFGQLQDQAEGYIFPVGLLFVLAKLLAIPGWVAQRIWISAILLAAFVGIVRLCRRLGIGTPTTRIAAGFAYALAPNALSTLGTLSSEFLPIAMLPWILLPLVRAAQAGPDMTAGGRLKAAAQSAVAVALCSGINAAATFAVLIPAVIYLLTVSRPAPRWRILAWWAPAVLLAVSWWLCPLLLQDKYGASILPYTESASITTSATSLFNTLRGTENWITYLVVNGKPWEPVAFQISTGALPTILTGLIAGLGLAGLLTRNAPHRRFLLCTLLTGLFVVVAGHVSAASNPFTPAIFHAINGPLAPFRNLRKFDPLIRLPIALGLAILLSSVRVRRPRLIASAVTAAAIGLLALPVYISGLGMAGSFASIPRYWVSAADWLNRHAGNQGILEEPGARFGQYTWGSPMDDVLQPLVTGNWASVQVSELGSVGNMRLLEAIDRQMAAGDGSPGLAELLAGLGVRYVVVRNDLLRADLYGAWPARIHQALAESPGIVKVAQFGQAAIRNPSAGNAISSFDAPYPPVEIYQVRAADPVAIVQPVSATMRVFGAPEAELALANDNVLKNRPVLLNADDTYIHAGYTVVTDSLRRVVRNFGEIRIDYSPTLTATTPLTTFDVATDFTEPGWERYAAIARYFGISNVTASSAASGILAAPSQFGTGRLPYAAIDGNLATMWESASPKGSRPLGQWIKIKFLRPVHLHTIRVAFADSSAIGPPVTKVKITTAAGRVADHVRITGGFQSLPVPAGASRWLKIAITGLRHQRRRVPNPQVGIKEIDVPGLHPSRTIEAPDVRLPGGADPSAVVLAKAEPQPSGCMLTSVRWVCSPGLERSTEEQYGFDESFAVSRAATGTLAGTAVLTSPRLIQAYAFPGAGQPAVTATSAYTADPEDQAYAAFDGNPLTTWISGASDTHPALTIRWHISREMSSVKIMRPPGASSPLAVRITGSGGQVRTGILGRPAASGFSALSFAPMKTGSMTFTFTLRHPPVQISEVAIPGVRPLTTDSAASVRLPCGRGPAITVNGTPVPTKASGTVGELLDGQPLAFSACSPVSVTAGGNRVVEPSSDGFSVQSVALLQPGPHLLSAGPTVPNGAVRIMAWGPAERLLHVSAAVPSYLIVAQNYNSGWQASLGGRVLQPVRLDGWEQGWLLPARSAGKVTLRYLPDGPYRLSIFAGLGAVLLIMIIAFGPWPRRRPQPASEAHAATPTSDADNRQPALDWHWPGHGGRRYAIFAAALLVTVFFGLWIGGYLGALLLPAATAVFLAASASGASSSVGGLLTSRWLVVGLLATASACAVLGTYTTSPEASALLSGSLPHLLSLAIVGRLAAALLTDFVDTGSSAAATRATAPRRG
jgi:arabinofuranan 3-O-arabinosyltransferase